MATEQTDLSVSRALSGLWKLTEIDEQKCFSTLQIWEVGVYNAFVTPFFEKPLESRGLVEEEEET